MVLVGVKVQGVKSICFKLGFKKLLIVSREAYLRTPNELHILYFRVRCWPRLYFLKVSGWPSPNNDMQRLRFL